MAAAAVSIPPTTMSEHHDQDEQRAELPRPYKCPLCDKAFHRLEHQTRHIRTHTGEKPHACNFPGCSKRFSRSDELTRHSRIHTNPNSRRGKNNHAIASAATSTAAVHGSLPEGQAVVHMMQPSATSWSNPASSATSPNVSPPHSYQPYGINTSSPHGPYGSYDNSPRHSPPEGPVSMNLLATAASQAARENELSSLPRPMYNSAASYSAANAPPTSYYRNPSSNSSNHRLPSLAAYHYSQPMSRSQSQDEDQYSHRATKRSRPGSPFSTAPPSPTFSAGSYSPTPGLTPALTPGQSPRIRPNEMPFENHLPGIRHLSLQHLQSPLLEPLEPSAEATGGAPAYNAPSQQPYSRSQNSSSSGLRISDIMNKEDGAQRKLPIPIPPGVNATELPSRVGAQQLPPMAQHYGEQPMDVS